MIASFNMHVSDFVFRLKGRPPEGGPHMIHRQKGLPDPDHYAKSNLTNQADLPSPGPGSGLTRGLEKP